MKSPNASASRIELIDVLRGFALTGIVIAHFIDQYFGGPIPSSIRGASDHESIKALNEYFISGKFLAIFSFLFGVSFYIQMRKADSTLWRFWWRLVVLFLIGFIHHLHYRGDILTTYAILGFVLTITYRLPDRFLIAFAFLLAINIPGTAYHVLGFLKAPGEVSMPRDLPRSERSGIVNPESQYFNTLKSGSYAEILRANLSGMPQRFKVNIWSGRVFVILGLFLIGYVVGRLGVFEKIEEYLPAIRKVFFVSLCGTLVICALPYFIIPLDRQGSAFETMVLKFLSDILNFCMAMFYITAVVLLFQWRPAKAFLLHFYAAGRMGLTTYLLQTFFGFLLFFGTGIGLLGEIDAVSCLFLGITVFVTQVIFSKWWLSRFQYGPFEWAWRSLTYLKLCPLQKARLPAVSAGNNISAQNSEKRHVQE